MTETAEPVKTGLSKVFGKSALSLGKSALSHGGYR
jgi:hypothetical protein